MSIFDGNRELGPEVLRQYEFYEDKFNDRWVKIIVNKNLTIVISLYFNESNNGYKVTGVVQPSFLTPPPLKLKETYIDNAIDLDTFMHCIEEMNFTNLFDYFELSI